MSPRAKRAEEVGWGEASSAHSAGGHLVALALELGAHPLICPEHGEEQWILGTKTGRVGHAIRTLDGRRAICVGGKELIEVRDKRNA